MTRAMAVIDSKTAGPAASSAQPVPAAAGAWSDWLGMIASIGCAIHCAAMPFVIAYLPALGLSFLADEAFHKWMAVGCFAIAVTAFIPGLRKHGRLAPVTIGSVGLVMISVAAFGFAGECCPSCETDGTLVDSTCATACTDAGCTLCPSGGPASAGDNSGVSSAGLAASSQTAPCVGRLDRSLADSARRARAGLRSPDESALRMPMRLLQQ